MVAPAIGEDIPHPYDYSFAESVLPGAALAQQASPRYAIGSRPEARRACSTASSSVVKCA